jgi:phage baseplate assembly protein gpV
MSITSERYPIAHLRRAVALSDAGQPAAAIATTLQAEGVPVPREDTNPRLLRHEDGSLFPAEGAPGRWTAAKVTAPLATPEADPTDGYATARAKLGSGTTTTLTVIDAA